MLRTLKCTICRADYPEDGTGTYGVCGRHEMHSVSDTVILRTYVEQVMGEKTDNVLEYLGTAFVQIVWADNTSGAVHYADSGGWQEPVPFDVDADAFEVTFHDPEPEPMPALDPVDATKWEALLSFRTDGCGNIALVDDMAEATLSVEMSVVDVGGDEAWEQMQRMLAEAVADAYGPH